MNKGAKLTLQNETRLHIMDRFRKAHGIGEFDGFNDEQIKLCKKELNKAYKDLDKIIEKRGK